MTTWEDGTGLILTQRVDELVQRVNELNVALAELAARLPEDAGEFLWFFDVRFPLKMANLYDPEYWDNSVKRWVGPEPVLEIALTFREGAEYEIEVHVLDFINERNEQEFEFRLDGVACGWRSTTGRVYQANFVAPRTGQMRLELACPCVESPHDQNPASSDERQLAFSLTRCSVRKVTR